MPKTRNPCPAEFREQMVALVRTGHSVESLAREYEPRAAAIHEWVRQAAADDGGDPNSLTSEQRDDLRQLQREVRQLRQERDILAKSCPLKVPLVRAQWAKPGLHKRM